MPILNRKRRAQAEPEPSPAPTRRRPSPSPSVTSASEDGSGSEIESTQSSSQEQMVKKLVRLALASEYSRTPIRRSDITAKVMPPGTGRQTNAIIKEANTRLRTTFGMELTLLPSRQLATVSQKRAAQRSGGNQASQGATSSSSNKTYILTSTLPAAYRHPNILPPAKIPSASEEGAYMGLVSFVVGLVYLSPGQSLGEQRLEKHLRRVNGDEYVLGQRTQEVVKRMCREGYLVKVKERDQGGEETVEFFVGARGKVEVGERGVAGLVREVYGAGTTGGITGESRRGGRGGGNRLGGKERKEIERRLVRSLGECVIDRHQQEEPQVVEDGKSGEEGEEEGDGEVEEPEPQRRRTRGRPSAGNTGRKRGRPSKNQMVEEEAEQDGEEDEDEEEDEEADEDEE